MIIELRRAFILIKQVIDIRFRDSVKALIVVAFQTILSRQIYFCYSVRKQNATSTLKLFYGRVSKDKDMAFRGHEDLNLAI